MVPLQLSSRPLQVSAEGCTLCWHVSAPAEQCLTPAAHTPGRPVLHAVPPPGSPSSMLPLQLLSMPSQISVAPGLISAELLSQSVGGRAKKSYGFSQVVKQYPMSP